jgi:hypothetical protein
MIISRSPAKVSVARTLSIVGHPFVFAPCAALLAILVGPHGHAMAWSAGGLFAAVVLAIGVFSWWQVRKGAWEHVDASRPHERGSLNRLAFGTLSLAAAATWFSASMRLSSVGFALGAALVAVGWLGLPRFKMSLHVSFAVFGASLLWPYGLAAVAAGCMLAGAVGWSRLILLRHSTGEVVAGAMVGAAAGVIHWVLLSRYFGVAI